MPMLFALATSVGVLAVGATWLFSLAPLAGNHLQVWQAFIAWGCHYHSGGKVTGTRNTVACMGFGSVVGMAAILLAGQLGSLGQLAAPVAVGLGAAVIVLASSVPLLATIPASVYGFASIAGLVLLGTGMSPTAALVPTILSVVIGAVFGYVSEIAANAGETARTGTFTATRSDLDHPGRREHDRAGARSRRQLSVRSRS